MLGTLKSYNKNSQAEEEDYYLSSSLTESKIDNLIESNNNNNNNIAPQNNKSYDHSHPMNINPTPYSLDLSDDRNPDELQVRIIKHCQVFNEEYDYLESFNYIVPTYEHIQDPSNNEFTDEFLMIDEEDDDFDPHLNINNKNTYYPASPNIINQSTELDFNHHTSPSPSLRQIHRNITPSPSLRAAPSPSIRASVSMAHFLSSSRSSVSLNTLAKSQSSASLYNQGLTSVSSQSVTTPYSNVSNHPPSPSPSPCIFAKTSASIPLSELDDKRARFYVQLAKRLIVSLVGQLSWLENIVNDFYNEVERNNAALDNSPSSNEFRDLMGRKIIFLYLLGNILGFDTLGNVIDRCDDLYDVLWDILNSNSLNLLSIKGIDTKCIQIITLLHLRNPKNEEIFPEMAQKEKEKLNSFKLEYTRWLMQILETRPESINGAICSAATSLKHQYQSSLVFQSSNLKDQISSPNIGIFSLNSNNLKLKMNQSSKSIKNSTGSSENLTIHANLFRSLSLLNNKDEDEIEDFEDHSSSIVQSKYKFYLYDKFNLNINLHNAAMFSLLEFSKDTANLGNDEINKVVLSEIWKIIFALERFLPHDLISLQPILLLLKLLLKNNSRLDLTTEASIVIFIIRSLNHNLLYIKYQACELIDFIGKVLPGFIYRAISRYEIEEPLIECFTNILSRLHHEFLLTNKSYTTETNTTRSDITYSSTTTSSFASIQKQSSRILISIIKAITSLVHNLNLRPYWCPSPYAYHWSVYKPLISTREVVSPRTVNFMLIALKYADISYRGTFLSHLLSYASSCLYIYSDGIYNPNNYEDKIRIKKLSEALVSSLLPLLPLALVVLMLITKKRRKLNLPMKIFYDDDVEDDEINSSIGKKNKKLTRKSKLINKILSLNSSNQYYKKFNKENSSSNGIQKKHYPNINPNSSSQGNSSNNLFNSNGALSNLNNNVNSSEQFLVNLSLYDTIDEVNKSLSIELLREKVFEATLSFFCRDEDFGLKPLTTYNRYAYLFQKQPLIANISMLMLDYFYNHIDQICINHPINLCLPFLEKYKKSNNHNSEKHMYEDVTSSTTVHAQLKKGLNILSHFIESEFQISAISMHSPLAFLSVFATFPDNIDIRQNLSKVILLLVKFGFFIPNLDSQRVSTSPNDLSRKSLNPSESSSTNGQYIVQSDLVDEFGLFNILRHGLHYGIVSNFKLKAYFDNYKQGSAQIQSSSTNNNNNKSLTNKMWSIVGMKNSVPIVQNSDHFTDQKNERKIVDIIKQSLVSLLCLGSSPQRLACILFDFDSPSLSSDTLNINLNNVLKKDKKKNMTSSNSNSSLNKKPLKKSTSTKSIVSNNSSSNNLLVYSANNNSPFTSITLSSSNLSSLPKIRALNKSNSLTNLNAINNEIKPEISSPMKEKIRSTTDLQTLSSNLFCDGIASSNTSLHEDDSNSQSNSDYFFGGDFEDESMVGRLAMFHDQDNRSSFQDKPKFNVSHLPTFDEIINCHENNLEKILEVYIHTQSYNSIFLEVAELIEVYPKDLSISYFATLFLAKICQYLPYFYLNLDPKKRSFVFSCLKKARKNLLAFLKVWKPCQISCNLPSVPSVTKSQVEDLLTHPLWTQGSCSVF